MGNPTHAHEPKQKDKKATTSQVTTSHVVNDASHAAHDAAHAPKSHAVGNRLASIAGAPLEYWWRNAVKQVFANNKAIHNMVSFDRSGDAHYMHFGPKALGIKVPVQLGLLGLQLSSGALSFKNPIVTRIVGEALEEVAFELTDLYNKGKLESQNDVGKAAKAAAEKIEEKFKIMCQVVFEDERVVAHHADCIMMTALNQKNPIKRTLEQVKAQGVPLATGCRFCGDILRGLQKEEAMGEHHEGHSSGGHNATGHEAHGAKTAKTEKMSGAEVLGKFGEKYPSKVRDVYEFIEWWGKEYPSEAQHFLANADKMDEFLALANAPDNETRRTIARSMLESRGLGGGLLTGIKNILGMGEKKSQSPETQEYIHEADERFKKAKGKSSLMKILGID